MRRVLVNALVLGVFLALLLSCNNFFGGGGSGGGGGPSGGVEGISANISGGRAVALGSSGVAPAGLSDSAIVHASVTNDQIFTVYEDGSMLPALEFSDGHRPEIAFTAVAPNGYLYVQLADHWGQDNLGLYAINIETDEVFVAGSGGTEGQVKTWYWDYSAIRTRPIVFSESGRAYFVVATWSPTWTDRIASWMPGEQNIRFETLAIEGVDISRFQIDSIGRKYVSGYISTPGMWGDYLQVFDPRANRGRYVFLSDGNDGWVRGYVAVGDRVILNGWNILGGYSGIVSLESSIVGGEIEFSQTLLFDNDTSDWFSPTYHSWYDDWSGQTVHRGLFVQSDAEYVWADHWRTGGQLDEDRIIAYLSGFYVEDIYLDFSSHTAGKMYTSAEISGGSNDNWYWLNENVKRAANPAQGAVTFYQWRLDQELPWLDFADISDMTVLGDGTLWGIYQAWGGNQPTVWLQLLNSAGERELQAVMTRSASGADVSASLIQFADERMYYRYRGDRIGTHRIAAVSRVGAITDVTASVTDIEFMTIYDYSVGGGYLYFSGYDGIDLITGRINLATGAYDRIETDTTITSIDVLY